MPVDKFCIRPVAGKTALRLKILMQVIHRSKGKHRFTLEPDSLPVAVSNIQPPRVGFVSVFLWPYVRHILVGNGAFINTGKGRSLTVNIVFMRSTAEP